MSNGRVARGAVLAGEEDRCVDRPLVVECALMKAAVLKDEQRGAEVSLGFDLLLRVAEEIALVVEPVGVLVPRGRSRVRP